MHISGSVNICGLVALNLSFLSRYLMRVQVSRRRWERSRLIDSPQESPWRDYLKNSAANLRVDQKLNLLRFLWPEAFIVFRIKEGEQGWRETSTAFIVFHKLPLTWYLYKIVHECCARSWYLSFFFPGPVDYEDICWRIYMTCSLEVRSRWPSIIGFPALKTPFCTLQKMWAPKILHNETHCYLPLALSGLFNKQLTSNLQYINNSLLCYCQYSIPFNAQLVDWSVRKLNRSNKSNLASFSF